MRRVIVGTAGHIDHGKTRLVEALTGIDCDRWREEKERGITIDLGFAHLAVAGDDDAEPLQLGFVDVPGHERFVHNALAGLGGVRLMMLVVAADEGMAAQTREHLDICSLLDVPAGLVALTKIDLVDEETRLLAQMELEEALEGSPFEGAPIVPVSAHTGEGVDRVKATLVELARSMEVDATLSERPARLPVDRVFVLRGLGVVTTGTLVSGTVAVGDTLERLPEPLPVRVRSIQIHGEGRERALAGERTSLQLGGIDQEQLLRGHQLVEPGAFRSSRSLLARLRLLEAAPRPLRGFVPIRFHLASSEAIGKLRPLEPTELRPGQEGLVEIRLDRPVVAIRDDPFVVRRPSPQTTLGGGRILDPLWLRRRGPSLERALRGLGGSLEGALLYWVEAAGEGGATTLDLARRLGRRVPVVDARLESFRDEQKLLEVPERGSQPRRWLLPSAYRRVVDRAQEVVRRYFEENRLAHGMPKAEALRRIAPGRARLLGDVYLEWLAKQKTLDLDGDLVKLPGRGSGMSESERSLADDIVEAFEQGGLTPESPQEICRRLRAKPQIFEGLVKHLVSGGRLVRLPQQLVLSRAAVDRLVADLRDTGWSEFGVPEFKDRFGLSRKWAIPLLEHLDQRRVTARVGDRRRLLPPSS